MLYRVDVLRDRIASLEHEHEDWERYLWLSPNSESGHRTPDTIANRFKRIAERAEASVDDQEEIGKALDDLY